MKPIRYEDSTKTIRSVPENHWIATMDSWDGAEDHPANAAFIVRAVNSHDALIAALELIAKDCASMKMSATGAAILARAALTLAKGE